MTGLRRGWLSAPPNYGGRCTGSTPYQPRISQISVLTRNKGEMMKKRSRVEVFSVGQEEVEAEGAYAVDISREDWSLRVSITDAGIIIKALEGKPVITAVEGASFRACSPKEYA